MDEREGRSRQAAKARRLIAKVQRVRLATPGDRADPKAKALLRTLEAAGAHRESQLYVELQDLGRRIRRNEPAWSVDGAAMRVTRYLRYGYGRRATGAGDPTIDYVATTDYGDPTTDYERVAGTDFGFRLRSSARMIRGSRSGKF